MTGLMYVDGWMFKATGVTTVQSVPVTDRFDTWVTDDTYTTSITMRCLESVGGASKYEHKSRNKLILVLFQQLTPSFEPRKSNLFVFDMNSF